jgi:excisionase family DNA binding protein
MSVARRRWRESLGSSQVKTQYEVIEGVRTESAPATAPAHWPFFLTVQDVASLLRTSQKAVYAMIERGQLPGVTRVGRRLLVRRDDLLHWLDRSRAPSP